MPGSLSRFLRLLSVLGLLVALGATVMLVALRAGEVERPDEVVFVPGYGPGVLVLEPADRVGPDPFTAPIAVDLGIDPVLLVLPPADPAGVLSPHGRHSAADQLAAGEFGFELISRRDRGQRMTVGLIEAVAGSVLGTAATLDGLEDGDGDGLDDDRNFTLTARDGSAVCIVFGEVRTLAAAQGLQIDPFDGAAVNGYQWDSDGPCDGADPGLDVPALAGSTPGVYGATIEGEVCDVGALVTALEAVPVVAATWAKVHGITADEIEDFATTLTPVILLWDTAVTDHGYDGSAVYPHPAVLQRGTAVLVDDRGTPVVRCLSGSPLLGPRALPVVPEIVGPVWAGFVVDLVIDVPPAVGEVGEFILLDVRSGAPIRRAPGITGALAGLAGPLVVVEG